MVMETPSPECVGREFVLQYYTMLHEAPRFLHRFYNSMSSYIHGGVGDDHAPAIGQAEIHKRIMALNFSECHTKIRHVDSQSTVSSAVVVQVSGELSNNGQPMRKFMQTFVLAPQSPNKYYVHNDIFRYQDEVFPDDSENEELQDENTACSTVAEVQTPAYYAPEHPKTNVEQAAPVSNGDVSHVEHHTAPEATVPETPRVPVAESQPVVAAAGQQQVPENPEAVQQQEPEPKNKTWSSVASRKGTPVAQPPVTARPAAVPAPKPAAEVIPPEPAAQRGPKPKEREVRHDAEKAASGAADVAVPEKRPIVPDSCQVFVGNLPPDIDINSLKEFFSSYGQVVDAKIFTSTASRIPYGFVMFTDEQPVKQILVEKRIEYKGHRVNVEEKKTRPYNGYSNRGRYVGPNPRSSFRPHFARPVQDSGTNHLDTNAGGSGPSRGAPAGLQKKIAV